MKFGISAFIIAALCASPVSAQLSTGRSGSPGVREADESEYFWAVRELGRCLYDSKPAESLALLSAARGSGAERTAKYALVGKKTMCVRHLSRMGISDTALRGTIAEAAFRAHGSPELIASDYPVPEKLARDEAVRLGTAGIVANMAECLVARYPVVTRSLLDTIMGSRREAEVTDQLAEPIDVCLPGKMKITIPVSDFRAAISEAAFQNIAETAK